MLIDSKILQLLDKKLIKLNKLRPLSPALLKKLKDQFSVDMTYNSNAIEGNTLTLKETYWVIQEGLTVKGKSMHDHLEAKNHKEALDYLYDLIDNNTNETISEFLIRNLHALVIQNINKDIAGKYRDKDVFITGTDHTPPSALDVEFKMTELINWAKENYKKMNTVEFSAIFHHKLVHIHPFEDGNGRTARLIMNVFLMKAGYPLVVIQKNDRQRYYRVLQFADKGDYKPLIKFVAQSTLRSLNIYLDMLTPAHEKNSFVPLSEAAQYCSYSKEYLGKLALKGKIDAFKKGRNWLTTKKAVLDYEAEQLALRNVKDDQV